MYTIDFGSAGDICGGEETEKNSIVPGY